MLRRKSKSLCELISSLEHEVLKCGCKPKLCQELKEAKQFVEAVHQYEAVDLETFRQDEETFELLLDRLTQWCIFFLRGEVPRYLGAAGFSDYKEHSSFGQNEGYGDSLFDDDDNTSSRHHEGSNMYVIIV